VLLALFWFRELSIPFAVVDRLVSTGALHQSGSVGSSKTRDALRVGEVTAAETWKIWRAHDKIDTRTLPLDRRVNEAIPRAMP
jgi:hypothetical protein